jgi:hypothetical protein
MQAAKGKSPVSELFMSNLVVMLLVLGAWLVLQYLVLPRLGVPT